MPGGDGGSGRIFDLFAALLAIPGPSGQEEAVRVWLRERWRGRLVDEAKANDIPFQHGVYTNDGSDAHAFFDHGIPAAPIGTPTRYTLTATEMVEESYIVATINLLRAFVTTPPAE